MKKAVFLDRDGTLIKDNGYISNIKDVVFYNFTFECLRKLQKKYLLFIVTNQSGISKGFLSIDDLDYVHNYILNKLSEKGIVIREIYSCPHVKEDNCICRKPNPYFINLAKEKYNLDVENSFVIGDHPSDIGLAINSGAKGIYVLTGHGQKHYNEIDISNKERIKICKSLDSACRLILTTFSV
jgi:D-glycero-D-manno-heptose 1,7-bisphosphate phosphatase